MIALLNHLLFNQKIIRMQYTDLKKYLTAFAFTAVFMTAFTHVAKAGLDSYEIYLNSRLILRQTVDKPLSLESLQLTGSNINDKLTIYYSQCNAPNKLGSGRKIVIRDAEGALVREWKFADAQGSKTGMEIPVKELLQLEKVRAGSLSLYYTADGHPQAQKLTLLQVGDKSTTYHHRTERNLAAVVVEKYIHS